MSSGQEPAYLRYSPNEERDRLFLQSEVFEQLSERFIKSLPRDHSPVIAEIACGAMGLLRPLARLAGRRGRVIATDVSDTMLEMAQRFCAEQHLTNVEFRKDDLFASALPGRFFDLVHARFVLAPLGRDDTVLHQLERIAKPGAWVVLEEPLSAQTIHVPSNGDHELLNSSIAKLYSEQLGGFDAGTRLLDAVKRRGWSDIRYEVGIVGLPPGHPYLRCFVLFARSLRSLLLRDIPEVELDAVIERAEAYYRDPRTFGATFPLAQVAARVPSTS
jgi:hypothetical protein